jgi:hypothetical protein
MDLSYPNIEDLAPITLQEMEGVELLNRKDTKFIFPATKVGSLLDYLKDDYFILELDRNRISSYYNTYFDTPARICYHEHHNRRMNRYKVRIREYTESGLTFLEVKFKNNKQRTVKSRMRIETGTRDLDASMSGFLDKHSPFSVTQLEPVIDITFKRITVVNKNHTERATIDIDLLAFNKNGRHSFRHLAIAELKQVGIQSGSVFKEAIRNNMGHEVRVSKYCIGLSSLEKDLKANQFKPKHLLINKLNKQQQYA